MSKEELFNACKEGNLEKVKSLYKKGIDLHINNNFAIRCSIHKEQYEITKFLLRMKANIYADNNYCLKLLVKHDNIDMLNYLLDNEYIGTHVLFKLAIKYDKLYIVEYMVKNGIAVHEDYLKLTKKGTETYKFLINRVHFKNKFEYCL